MPIERILILMLCLSACAAPRTSGAPQNAVVQSEAARDVAARAAAAGASPTQALDAAATAPTPEKPPT